jgi:hypothetical protein
MVGVRGFEPPTLSCALTCAANTLWIILLIGIAFGMGFTMSNIAAIGSARSSIS